MKIFVKNKYELGKLIISNQLNENILDMYEYSHLTDLSNMFAYENKEQLLYCPKLDTSNVVNMSYMFSDCFNLRTIPELDTSNVVDMSYMFSNCRSLKKIPKLDTKSLINLNYLFIGCNSLKEIHNLKLRKDIIEDCFDNRHINKINFNEISFNEVIINIDIIIERYININTYRKLPYFQYKNTKIQNFTLINSQEKVLFTFQNFSFLDYSKLCFIIECSTHYYPNLDISKIPFKEVINKKGYFSLIKFMQKMEETEFYDFFTFFILNYSSFLVFNKETPHILKMIKNNEKLLSHLLKRFQKQLFFKELDKLKIKEFNDFQLEVLKNDMNDFKKDFYLKIKKDIKRKTLKNDIEDSFGSLF